MSITPSPLSQPSQVAFSALSLAFPRLSPRQLSYFFICQHLSITCLQSLARRSLWFVDGFRCCSARQSDCQDRGLVATLGYKSGRLSGAQGQAVSDIYVTRDPVLRMYVYIYSIFIWNSGDRMLNNSAHAFMGFLCFGFWPFWLYAKRPRAAEEGP